MPGTRPKLLHIALGMIFGSAAGSKEHQMGYALQYQLANAYKNIRSGKPSRAAHYKRLAKKRRIQRARSKK